MKKYLIIYNPTAGKKGNKKWIDKLAERIEQNGGYCEVYETTGINDGRKEVCRSAHKFDIVVSAGGDGTLNEVAAGILESKSDAKLGILPIGSGNDYYRNFANPKDMDTAMKSIVSGKVNMIDVGKSEDNTYLLNIASIGLDCLTVKNAKKLKKIAGGPFGYFLSLIYSLATFKKQNLTIYIDENKIYSKSSLYCFGCGKTYGGGIKIMPWSGNFTGKFEIVNISEINKGLLIFFAPSIALGLHTKFEKYVKVYSAKKIRVESENKFDFNLDGEIFEEKKVIEYECMHNAIGLLI